MKVIQIDLSDGSTIMHALDLFCDLLELVLQ